MRAIDCGQALGCDLKEALGAAAAFGSRLTLAGLHVALGFEAIERSVDGPDGNFTTGACLDLLAHGDAVGVISKTQEREKYGVLEFAEVVAAAH